MWKHLGPGRRLLSPEAMVTRKGIYVGLFKSTATLRDMLELPKIVE